MPQIYFAHGALDGQSGHDAGRALLKKLYDQYVGGQMPPISIESGGKPYFADSPWHFSISHTKRHAFCVLSDVPVGIDGEELSRKVSHLLAEKALSKAEQEQYRQAKDKNKALLTFWVLKEAQGKCNGKGIGIHPNHTNFSLTDDRVFECDGCLVAIVYE